MVTSHDGEDAADPSTQTGPLAQPATATSLPRRLRSVYASRIGPSERALLLDLEDVYWAQDGRTSVDAAVGAIVLGAIYFAAAPFWRDAGRELVRTRALVS